MPEIEKIKMTEEVEKKGVIEKTPIEKIGQEQFHHFVFGEDLSWQEIIYDLINTEQLDPWDMDLSVLAQKYLGKISELEEANFALGSKVLLVASLLLRIKSELLLNRYIKDLDDVLFGRKEEKQERLVIAPFDENDIPELIPKTPLPRYKKISLDELMSALNKAIKTETRRETKKILEKQIYERAKFFMPKKTINLSQRIKHIHGKVIGLFQKNEKIKFSEFAGPKKQDKIDSFIPLLHLDNHDKLWLHQKEHFDEIYIHKDGREFVKEDDMIDDIITDRIEKEFERYLRKAEKVKSIGNS